MGRPIFSDDPETEKRRVTRYMDISTNIFDKKIKHTGKYPRRLVLEGYQTEIH